MCGIFALLSSETIDISTIQPIIENIKHRGPDSTHILLLNNNKLIFGFHRLAINDLTSNGEQPFTYNGISLICNGEIYNHKELRTAYGITTHGDSDCEIILHLYIKFGIEKTLTLLSGYFGFTLYDSIKDVLYVARDIFGVRALYFGENETGLAVCSELKGIPMDYKVSQFPPGSYYSSDTKKFIAYHDYKYKTITGLTEEHQMFKMRTLFEQAVKKRFMSDRPFGVFLSGGLDSSLVAALVARQYGQPIHTFSIGMAGSTDLCKAKLVADHIKSIHHEVIVTEQQMLDAIPDVIKQIESYDTTTVRASTPMYLLSKYIKENSDIVVIFSGEGSDEASGSYLYFHNAPDAAAFQEECVRLLKDLCFFDCLRCDKATAGNGLEVRVPFLDTEFLIEYMKVPAEMKMPRNGMEKYFIRKAFDGLDLLPDEILYRKKEAFSDGVSSTEKSWFRIIQEFIDTKVTDEEFKANKDKITPNPPMLKESYFYRKLFDQYYPGRADTLPYYWLPKWSGGAQDPSARTLKVYNPTD